MIGEAGLKRAADRVLSLASGEGRAAEVVLVAADSALTRFANNEVHQNVAERNVEVHVRIAIGKKVGSASGNGLEDESLRQVVEQATTVARLQRENPDFPGFPGPHTVDAGRLGYAEDTASATPEARAERVGVVCRRSLESGFVAAGACSTGVVETAVANSLGTWAYRTCTHSRLLAVVTGETSAGYSLRQGAGFSSLDAETLVEEAVSKAQRGRDPGEIEPGEYDVVLEPYAADDIIRFISYLGLNGRAHVEKTSFAHGRLGERLLGEQFTLCDEPLDLAGAVQPFDYEGVPKRPLTLVERGVVQAATYDSLTGAKAGAKAGTHTTGHAGLGPGASFYGPIPTNLALQPGTQTREALVRQIDRGLWISRFWYTRTVHPLSVSVTGMTRDSVFMIENGEITRPVKSLRFTQSYVAALNQIIGVGNDTRLVGDGVGSPVLTPSLAIRAFTFTGKSDY